MDVGIFGTQMLTYPTKTTNVMFGKFPAISVFQPQTISETEVHIKYVKPSVSDVVTQLSILLL